MLAPRAEHGSGPLGPQRHSVSSMVFSNTGQNLAEAMTKAVMMPQPSTEKGRQAFQRIQELIAVAADRIPAPSDASVTRSRVPRNSGAQPPHRSNRSPHRNPECHRVPTLQLVDNGGGGQGGGGGRHTTNGGDHEDDGLTMTWEAVATPTARATLVTTGEIQGISPNQHHVLSRMTAVTW
jgi:hypothetical protein